MLESYHIEYTHTLHITYTHYKDMLTRIEHTKIYSSMELQHMDILQPASVRNFFHTIFIIHLVLYSLY